MSIGEQQGHTPYMTTPTAQPTSIMHTPERMMQEAELLRQQAELFEQQRQESENRSRKLEEGTIRKTSFNADLNELGQRLHNASRRIAREIDSMERERQEMEQFYDCFQQHLQILSALQPQHWAPESIKDHLREALPKLDRADNDFHEAYACGREFRHTQLFHHKPGEQEAKPKFGMKTIRQEMLKGLAFHLPLFLLILISWGIYSLLSA